MHIVFLFSALYCSSYLPIAANESDVSDIHRKKYFCVDPSFYLSLFKCFIVTSRASGCVIPFSSTERRFTNENRSQSNTAESLQDVFLETEEHEFHEINSVCSETKASFLPDLSLMSKKMS